MASDQWNGLPENPERDGWHWLLTPDGEQTTCYWRVAGECERGRWPSAWLFDRGSEWSPIDCTYLGPCIPPSELAAAEAAAAREAVEDCAGVADAEARQDQTGCNPALLAPRIAAAIRALPRCPSGALDRMIAEAEKRGYKEGWNDREGDLLNSIDRVYGAEARRWLTSAPTPPSDRPMSAAACLSRGSRYEPEGSQGH